MGFFKNTTDRDAKKLIKNHINKFNIKKNSNLLVTANLASFGLVNNQIPKFIIDYLLKKIGKNGTLVMPLYNFSIKNKTYDKNSYIEINNNSALSTFFFKNYKTFRTNSIIHSHIVSGKLMKKFNRKVYESFGINSDFDLFNRFKFKQILIGCSPDEGLTYIHHLEQMTEVKYRYFKKIKYKVKINGKNKQILINYFSRKNNIKQNFNKILKVKELKKYIKSSKLLFGTSYHCQLNKLDKIFTKYLSNNLDFLNI